MNEADIMALTFFHTCTIKRSEQEKVGNITREKMVNTYEDIPCAVSSSGGSNEQPTDEYVPVVYNDTLYTRPDVEVREGDFVITKNNVDGSEGYYIAGKGVLYPSHRQTPLVAKDRA